MARRDVWMGRSSAQLLLRKMRTSLHRNSGDLIEPASRQNSFLAGVVCGALSVMRAAAAPVDNKATACVQRLISIRGHCQLVELSGRLTRGT
jgi:hypothetical protein